MNNCGWIPSHQEPRGSQFLEAQPALFHLSHLLLQVTHVSLPHQEGLAHPFLLMVLKIKVWIILYFSFLKVT